VIAVVKQRTGETEIVLTSSLNTPGSSGWLGGVRSVAPHALSLLGEVVQGPHEVQHLHHVQSPHFQAGPGRVVRVVHAVTEPVRQGRPSTAHEVIEEVVHKFDNVHDGFRALDDLSVKRGLDVTLDIVHKILLDIFLELRREEGLLSSASHLWVADEERQHLGNVRHQTLQKSEGHGEEQSPGTNLGLCHQVGVRGMELSGEGLDHVNIESRHDALIADLEFEW